MLQLLSTRRLGEDEETREYDVETDPDVFVTRVTFSGFRIRTINVRAENYELSEEGFDLLERIRLRLSSDATGEALNAVNLSLYGDEDVRPIEASAGNRAVPFASLDILLNQTLVLVVDRDPETSGDSYIEAVDIEEARYE